MVRGNVVRIAYLSSALLLAGLCLLGTPCALAQQPPLPVVVLPDTPQLEPKAIAILKAMSDRLAAARTMTFSALTTYESPARTGQPLAYTTLSEVTLERPDKLRVITPGDGPRSEFYYDGKTMMAYAPESGHVAVADAPPTIDAMLKEAYGKAAIYFPFSDVIVADPYKDIADGLKEAYSKAAIYYSFSDVIVADPYKDIADGLRLAFVVGQSRVVGGTLTDIVALANDTVQVELWIGAEDKLPRLARATYFNEPGYFRHVVELSDWHLDPAIPPGSFTSAAAAKAIHIDFASPDEKLPRAN